MSLRNDVTTLMTIIVCLTSGLTLVADDEPTTPDFTKDVAPILTKYCAGCHNDDDREGGLSLESFASLQLGTDDGPALLPGDATGSRIIRVLSGEEPLMPPEDEPRPSEAELAILTRWIDAGAKGPEGAEPNRLMLVVPEIKSHVDRRPIAALDQSPDGKRLAVARYGEVLIYDVPDGAEIVAEKPDLSLKDFPGNVTSVHFTADGTQLVTASGVTGLGGVAAIWDLTAGESVKSFEGHRDILYEAELSPDGSLLATSSYDRLIVLWDVESGKQVRTLAGHNGAVYDVGFSPDGEYLVSASADDTCKVWRVSDGERLDTLGQPLKEQYTCMFSPDGRTIVAGGADNRIRVWQFISKDRPRINPLLHARFAHEGAVLRVGFTSDGARLVSVADDRTVKLWDTSDYTELHLWEQQPDVAFALAISPDDKSFRVGRQDGSIEQFSVMGDRTSNKTASTATAVESQSIPMPDELAEVQETEPNNAAGEAMTIEAPVTITGTIYRASTEGEGSETVQEADLDMFRFAAKAGQEWAIEVNAARSESPLDSFVEVLTADGERIERAVLQAVRDSYFTFRGKDADTSGDFRIFNWEEMTLNQYLYSNGEVSKLWLYPRGPDSGFNVYPGQGQRWGFFDTTPLAHALNEPCYVVEPHPPETELIPNGLPVFTLYYENDDESRRSMGNDSKLFFTAPDDGEYLVKLKDVRGQQGENFSYALTIRPTQPDFEITVDGKEPAISPGSAKEFVVRATRKDGYDGPIRVDISGLPVGFDATTPVTIQAGQVQAMGVIWANNDAVAPEGDAAKSSVVTATADIRGQDVTHEVGSLGEIKLGEAPKLTVEIQPAPGGAEPLSSSPEGPLEFAITPGETIMLQVEIHRHAEDGVVSLGKETSGRNLPHGLYVDNIGLNGLLLLEGQSKREFFITADTWVPDQTRVFHLSTDAGGGHASRPVILHVRRDQASSERASR
ncbi:MAG: hypothetical protein KDA93_22575 [Planctomycetaceae bacterium]|nr:hypothetical protein [Planctomycetaceae bacterium]